MDSSAAAGGLVKGRADFSGLAQGAPVKRKHLPLYTQGMTRNSARFDAIDALRALAMLWMTAYHFCFDLNHLGWLHQNFFQDPFWTVQRTLIVSLFLLCAGLGQSVAQAQGQGWPRFWRRWAQVAACALAVSAGSYLMFPNSFIYFGVLHGLAVMLILARLSAAWGRWLWIAGAAALGAAWAAPMLHQAWPAMSVLDGRALNWLGLITHKPVTEDYVPVLPWLGVMWWGLAAGQWLMRSPPAWLTRPLPQWGRWLAPLGRISLSWYMLHQPVLLGALMAWRWAFGQG